MTLLRFHPSFSKFARFIYSFSSENNSQLYIGKEDERLQGLCSSAQFARLNWRSVSAFIKTWGIFAGYRNLSGTYNSTSLSLSPIYYVYLSFLLSLLLKLLIVLECFCVKTFLNLDSQVRVWLILFCHGRFLRYIIRFFACKFLSLLRLMSERDNVHLLSLFVYHTVSN